MTVHSQPGGLVTGLSDTGLWHWLVTGLGSLARPGPGGFVTGCCQVPLLGPTLQLRVPVAIVFVSVMIQTLLNFACNAILFQ